MFRRLYDSPTVGFTPPPGLPLYLSSAHTAKQLLAVMDSTQSLHIRITHGSRVQAVGTSSVLKPAPRRTQYQALDPTRFRMRQQYPALTTTHRRFRRSNEPLWYQALSPPRRLFRRSNDTRLSPPTPPRTQYQTQTSSLRTVIGMGQPPRLSESFGMPVVSITSKKPLAGSLGSRSEYMYRIRIRMLRHAE